MTVGKSFVFKHRTYISSLGSSSYSSSSNLLLLLLLPYITAGAATTSLEGEHNLACLRSLAHTRLLKHSHVQLANS